MIAPMLYRWRWLTGFIVALFASACATTHMTMKYPDTRKCDQVDDYHGVKIADPYRWLENPESPESRTWIDAQTKITDAWSTNLSHLGSIRARIAQLWNYERYGVPFRQGLRYFYVRNDGLQNQSVLYTLDHIADAGRVLLDPNKLSADGTVALKGYAASEDGRYLAYGTSAAGSDWEEWHVRDIQTGTDASDVLKWVKFSGASWTIDGNGFFYSRYDEPKGEASLRSVNYFQKLYYHRVGGPQSVDVLVYERPDQKEWGFGGEVTEDGRYLIIRSSQGTDTRERIFYLDLNGPMTPAAVRPLLKEFDASYQFIGNVGETFYFVTDKDAPRGKLIAVPSANPVPSAWKEIIPQGTSTLSTASLVGNRLIANTMKDAASEVLIYSLDGRLERKLNLPGIGSATGFSGKSSSPETFYSFASFSDPSTIYRLDVSTGESTVYRRPKVAFDPADYVTKQVFYPSKDSTKIPMFITMRKSLALNGKQPTLLYGYGGFNISLPPSFSPGILAWMEMGGIYAQPNLRGGGEYGEAWHKAGTKLQKQNVFDDFIAAAEWLIANNYTTQKKLGIYGRSNGGLLIGACLTQRPDLFGAAVPAVGVLDMLRFHKFTIGWAWTSDYGSSDNAEEFRALLAYSPLHQIKPATHYPPTLIYTADHDDRVVPAHSFKFAATLQEAQGGSAPILIRIDTKSGHGAGKPTGRQIDEAAERYAFLFQNLNAVPDFSFKHVGRTN